MASEDRLVITCLHPKAIVPTKESFGWKLHAINMCILYPGERVVLRTGISVRLPEATTGCLAGVHRNAVDHGTLVAPCLIEPDQEIRVVLFNVGRSKVHINPGDCIATMMFHQTAPMAPVHVLWETT